LAPAFLAGSAGADEQRFDCIMDPARTVHIGSPVAGVLESVAVDRGDVIEAGQPIAQIKSEVEKKTLELLKLRAADRSTVEAQTARLGLLASRRKRTERLLARGVATRDAMEEIETDEIAARNMLAEAENERAIAAAEVARARAALELRSIESPLAGIVTERHLNAGEYAEPDTPIVTVVQLDPLHVETFLPIGLSGRIAENDTAVVYPAAPIGGAYEARVEVVDRVFDSASGTFGVRLRLDNPGQKLPGGFLCTVAFSLDGGS
jgi:RND family efflux transporter MFP subunit